MRSASVLELARAIERVEVPRVGLARERAEDLLHPLRFQQRGEARVAVSGVVVDDSEVARALGDQRVDQGRGHACIAEAADHHRRAVRDVRERGFSGGKELVDHRGENYRTALPHESSHLSLLVRSVSH
jgi:hypothetical protein